METICSLLWTDITIYKFYNFLNTKKEDSHNIFFTKATSV